MTLVLFAWLSDQRFFRELTDINTLAELKEKTEQQLDEELLPFGFIDTGDDIPDAQGWIEYRTDNSGF
jgi:hypothetical protein